MSSSSVSPSTARLQENLHELLTRLAVTMEHVNKWPASDGDETSIHVESTSKLISNIEQVISALQNVEGVVQTDEVLRKSLQECLVPLDLLDLMDSKLNPDCFSRGLLKEALGQLAGQKRRKLALELLGVAVQRGLDNRLAARGSASATRSNVMDNKRSTEVIDLSESPEKSPAKKQRVSD